jgi:adenine-specific DNA-methyltransferase
LGLGISTGPIVDFRLSDHLLKEPLSESVPLLYPMHFSGNTLTWPKAHAKKPNAIRLNEETQRWLFPNGYYVVTKRFSAKEEKRRVVASVVEPSFNKTEWIGFENHLNVFHHGKKPIPKLLAYGLAAFLNSTFVDDYFRSFNGHTQVNATDLKSLRYPSKPQLMALGAKAQGAELEQSALDHLLLELV